MAHPFRLPTLLLAAVVCAAPAAAQTAPVVVDDSHLLSLQGRLDGFAAGLSADERALWENVLRRAASVPAASGEVRVTPILEIGPSGGCDDPRVTGAANRVAIIVQGGRTGGADGIIVQGGRTAGATGIVVQGGRVPQRVNGSATPGGRAPAGGRPGGPGDVRRPTDAVSIGPKQEDPARPAPEFLGRRLTELSAQLPPAERSALEWLLTRAEAAPGGVQPGPGGLPEGAAVAAAPDGRPATSGGRPSGAAGIARPIGQPAGPGGLPAGAVSLRQALGIDAVSIGPKQEDPTRGPPRPATSWILRY